MDFSYIDGQINKPQPQKQPPIQSSLEPRSIEKQIEYLVSSSTNQEQKKEMLFTLDRQLNVKKSELRDSIELYYEHKYDHNINLLNSDPKNEKLKKMISDDIDIFEKNILKNKLESKEIKKDMLILSKKRRELESSENKLNLKAKLNNKGLSGKEKRKILEEYKTLAKKENKNKVHKSIKIINEEASGSENSIELKKMLANNFINQRKGKIEVYTKKIEDIKSLITTLEGKIEKATNEFSIKKIKHEINKYMVTIHNEYLKYINSSRKSIAVLSEFLTKLK